MPYCPDCGVEIGNADACPLCGAANPRKNAGAATAVSGGPRPAGASGTAETECSDELQPSAAAFLGRLEGAEAFTPGERKKVAWEVTSVAFAIAVTALAAINLLVEARLSWAWYPMASLAFLWVLATAFLLMKALGPLRWILAAADPLVFLLALGLFTGDLSWAIRLAIPIAAFAEFSGAIVAILTLKSKRKGLNVIAYTLLGAALTCLGIEIFVDLFALGEVSLGWSAVTATSLVPIAGFLMYLHFRVARTTNLHRLFRL